MKKFGKVFLYILVLLMVLSFAMKFDAIAQPVSEVIGQPLQSVKDLASLVFFSSLGVFLIWAGVATMAVPVVGVALIVVGLALLSVTLWNHFKTPTLEKEQ